MERMSAGSSHARIPGAALAVVLAGVAAALHLGKLPPAVPALQATLGIDLVEAGFLLSLVQVAGMCLGMVVGLMADVVGLRRSMLAGLAVVTVASVLGGLVGNTPDAALSPLRRAHPLDQRNARDRRDRQHAL